MRYFNNCAYYDIFEFSHYLGVCTPVVRVSYKSLPFEVYQSKKGGNLYFPKDEADKYLANVAEIRKGYTAKEVQNLLHVSNKTLIMYRDKWGLQYQSTGRGKAFYYSRESVEAFMRANNITKQNVSL